MIRPKGPRRRLTRAMKSAADAPSAEKSSQSPAYLFVASSVPDPPRYGSLAQSHCCFRLKIDHLAADADAVAVSSCCSQKAVKDASSASSSHLEITSHSSRLHLVQMMTQSSSIRNWVQGPITISIDVRLTVDAQEGRCQGIYPTTVALLHRQSVRLEKHRLLPCPSRHYLVSWIQGKPH